MWIISHSAALGLQVLPPCQAFLLMLRDPNSSPHDDKSGIIPSEPLPSLLEVQPPVAQATSHLLYGSTCLNSWILVLLPLPPECWDYRLNSPVSYQIEHGRVSWSQESTSSHHCGQKTETEGSILRLWAAWKAHPKWPASSERCNSYSDALPPSTDCCHLRPLSYHGHVVHNRKEKEHLP